MSWITSFFLIEQYWIRCIACILLYCCDVMAANQIFLIISFLFVLMNSYECNLINISVLSERKIIINYKIKRHFVLDNDPRWHLFYFVYSFTKCHAISMWRNSDILSLIISVENVGNDNKPYFCTNFALIGKTDTR